MAAAVCTYSHCCVCVCLFYRKPRPNLQRSSAELSYLPFYVIFFSVSSSPFCQLQHHAMVALTSAHLILFYGDLIGQGMKTEKK